MSLLAVASDRDGVTSEVLDDVGRVVARAQRAVTVSVGGLMRAEQAAEELWRAVLAAATTALTAYDGAVEAVRLAPRWGACVLWDRETLGAARPVLVEGDRRAVAVCDRLRSDGHADRILALAGRGLDGGAAEALGPRLAWIAEHEPRVWGWVSDERVAVGTTESYLAARMTRGVWHATTAVASERSLLLEAAVGAWSAELAALLTVPLTALPELLPSVAPGASATSPVATDPGAFLGLAVPVTWG